MVKIGKDILDLSFPNFHPKWSISLTVPVVLPLLENYFHPIVEELYSLEYSFIYETKIWLL